MGLSCHPRPTPSRLVLGLLAALALALFAIPDPSPNRVHPPAAGPSDRPRHVPPPGDPPAQSAAFPHPPFPDLRAQLVARDPPWRVVLLRLAAAFPRLQWRIEPADQARRQAAEVLAALGPSAHPLLADLAQADRLARRPDTLRAIRAAWLRAGPEAIAALLPLCLDASAPTRQRALECLAEVLRAHPAPDPLARELATVAASQLADPREDVLLAALEVLRGLESNAEVALPVALDHLVHHPSSKIRAACARTVASIALQPGRCLPALIGALADTDVETRVAAAAALGRFGPEAAPAVPHLEDLLSHRHARVALAVANTLGRIGPAAASAAPLLVANLRHPQPIIRGSAAAALGRIHPEHPSVLPALALALRDTDPFVQLQAVAALGAYGPDASSAVPALIQALSDPGEGVRSGAAEALGRIGPAARSALPHLHAARHNNQSVMNPPVRRAIALIQGGENTP